MHILPNECLLLIVDVIKSNEIMPTEPWENNAKCDKLDLSHDMMNGMQEVGMQEDKQQEM